MELAVVMLPLMTMPLMLLELILQQVMYLNFPAPAESIFISDEIRGWRMMPNTNGICGKVRDHTVERQVIVVPLLGQLDEVRHGLGRSIGIKLHGDIAHRRVQNGGLLGGQLLLPGGKLPLQQVYQ